MLTELLSRLRNLPYSGSALSRVPTQERVVFLTFDDGPSQPFTENILEVLAALDVKATFFLSGVNLKKYPTLGKTIWEQGHGLGNHFYSHEYLLFKSEKFLQEGIEATDQLIRQTGYSGPLPFRPPHGVSALRLPSLLKKMRKTTVFWTHDSRDYLNIDANLMMENLTRRPEPGSILLMHDGRAPDRKALVALKESIGVWKAQGFRFELLTHFLTKEERK